MGGWAAITAAGGVLISALGMVIGRRSGARAGVSVAAIAMVPYVAQQLIVRWALASAPPDEPHDLDAIDAITLSRGTSASIVAALGLVRPGGSTDLAGRIAWPVALVGSTLTDWIDGPLARRRDRGASRLGRVLDLELDSALTLATSFAAIRLGGAHPACVLVPSLRYLALMSRVPYGAVFAVGTTARARNLGIPQMALALISFAPFAGQRTHAIARRASLALTPIHALALIAALPRAWREVRAGGPEPDPVSYGEHARLHGPVDS